MAVSERHDRPSGERGVAGRGVWRALWGLAWSSAVLSGALVGSVALATFLVWVVWTVVRVTWGWLP